MPGVPLSTPPASTTVPVASPVIDGGVVGAVDDDGDDLRSAVDREDRKRIAQYLPDIARLHVRIAVVQRVGPHPGGGERIGAVAFGARGRRADRGPGIARVVDVGGVQIAGRGRGARRAVVDPAGLESPPRWRSPLITAASLVPLMVMVTSCCGAVDRGGGERVGQRLPDIERLHGGVAVVQRVGPQPSRCQRVGAVAAGARSPCRPRSRRRSDCRGRWSSDRRSRSGVPGVPLSTPPASTTAPLVTPLITAASLVPWMVMVTSCGGAVDREDRKRIGQRLPDIARLHGGIVVVQRVGPDTIRRQRVAAEFAPQRRVDGFPEVVGIVDVGRVQIAGRGRGARRAVVDPAGLGHRPVGDAADHCGVVPAGDGDGHQLWVPSTVVAVNVSVSVCPTLSACTAGLLLSSV